jgi:phosphoribosylformimino-5-aminoimidazole carboxamide ribotide isomerase
MIEIIPSIDIIGGKCVRLEQGNYMVQKMYNENPLEVAQSFENSGLKRLHLVDLDGAKASHIVNIKVLSVIASNTELIIDFGGGIKSDEDLQKVFDNGAKMATIGSIAITDPEKLYNWTDKFGGDKIILGADVKNYKIAISGWMNSTDIDIFEFLAEKKNTGIKKVLCTDISKDGMLKGPSFELYNSIRQQFADLYIIASGGVKSVSDIEYLNKAGIDAVVVGKAIYENKISLKELNKYV